MQINQVSYSTTVLGAEWEKKKPALKGAAREGGNENTAPLFVKN